MWTMYHVRGGCVPCQLFLASTLGRVSMLSGGFALLAGLQGWGLGSILSMIL